MMLPQTPTLSRIIDTWECSCVFSTAAQQRNSGDDCNTDDTQTSQKQLDTVRALEKKAMKLEEQINDLNIRYQRAVADSENVKRRTQKFVEDAKLFGIQSFCRDLVEVADMVEKTTEHVAQEKLNSEEAALQTISEGLLLIGAKLQSVFAKHGLRKMNPIGGAYDPYDHEVVCHVPSEGMKPGTVTIVSQDGYKLHGRTIRHAHVGLAVESQQ
ncbi:grpE protein homolog 2, mitochondrial isoform X2 [Microcaecilia unicolor]|uniref:GrpE protein homolog 2, mitochondrial isoform X2 n=1 Tax=Microcaecilia unicolor TaxID=1415580 RepID=A0A6P7YWD3_9AMPH|nr:grpE protein homolog 2, mitochondrial isoform X2 [Microcaecilia unicolor]